MQTRYQDVQAGGNKKYLVRPINQDAANHGRKHNPTHLLTVKEHDTSGKQEYRYSQGGHKLPYGYPLAGEEGLLSGQGFPFLSRKRVGN